MRRRATENTNYLELKVYEVCLRQATDNKLRFMDLREIASSDSLKPSGTEDRNARENDNCASLFCVTHSLHNIALTWRSASVTGLGLKAHHCFTKRRTAAASTGIALATNRKSMRASLLAGRSTRTAIMTTMEDSRLTTGASRHDERINVE